MAKPPMNVQWKQSNLNQQAGPPGQGTVAGNMSELAGFAAAYPADAIDGSSESQDFISFKAFSNRIPGYTSGRSSGAAGEGEFQPQGNVKLFIPETVTNSSKSNYEGTNAGSLVSGLSNIRLSMMDDTEAAGIMGFLGVSLDSLGNAAGAVAGQAGDSADVAAQAMGMTLAAANRHVIFRGIEYRSFQYQYNIMPRSSDESANIADIIKWFRIQMLPDVGGNGNFFTPPNYFEIQYFINGVEAEYMHKIKPSVLTDCEVTYGGNGSFGKFKNTGAPSVIAMNLTFQEVQFVTKSDAAAGY